MKPGSPQTGWQWVRFVGNYVNLSTIVGLAVAKLGRATVRRGPRGLYLGEGYHFKFPVAGAFTIGNVVTTSSTWDKMLIEYPYLIKHEEGHTWQYLYCIGLPFYVAYGICMGWSVLRTGDRAARNFSILSIIRAAVSWEISPECSLYLIRNTAASYLLVSQAPVMSPAFTLPFCGAPATCPCARSPRRGMS